MKILIDIGHPAHVHYFKNFIKEMELAGHVFLIVAKDRNVTHELLSCYAIPFVKRKDYPRSLFGKLINIPITDIFIIKLARKFEPNIMIGFSGTHISHAGKILGIPSIVMDDTDHASLAHLSYKSFATHILTPSVFSKDFGNKHIRFKGFTDLLYLHPNKFKPDPNIRIDLNLKKDDKLVVLRFISWTASHDKRQSGINEEHKMSIVRLLIEYGYKVFISSEDKLPDQFEIYKLNISAESMHSVLNQASLFIGESGTMATESAILGTPSVLINSLDAGVFQELVKYKLLYHFKNTDRILEKVKDIVKIQNLKEKNIARRNRLLESNIDVTAFLVWFIENYPGSAQTMKSNSDYQYCFT